MGFKNGGDLQTGPAGFFQIHTHIQAGINHESFVSVTHKIRPLHQAVGFDLFKIHGSLLFYVLYVLYPMVTSACGEGDGD